MPLLRGLLIEMTPEAATGCPAPAFHPFSCCHMYYGQASHPHVYASICLTAACYAIHQAKSANCSSAGSMPAVACPQGLGVLSLDAVYVTISSPVQHSNDMHGFHGGRLVSRATCSQGLNPAPLATLRRRRGDAAIIHRQAGVIASFDRSLLDDHTGRTPR